MPFKQLRMFTEWITLNLVNGAFLLKDWLIINIGAGTTAALVQYDIVDNMIKACVGATIVLFNIVRIVKYIQDIKHKNDERKN